jgi:hypothetical protein
MGADAGEDRRAGDDGEEGFEEVSALHVILAVSNRLFLTDALPGVGFRWKPAAALTDASAPPTKP